MRAAVTLFVWMQLMQEAEAEVEGFPEPDGTLSRWSREGCINVTKFEAPHLLSSLLGQVA